MAPGNPCAPESTSTQQMIALPSAMWGSNGWPPLRSFCCFVGELWCCSACRLCTGCLRFVRSSAGPYPSPQRERCRVHRLELRDWFLLLRSILPDHDEAASPVQLAGLSGGNRALRPGRNGTLIVAQLQKGPVPEGKRGCRQVMASKLELQIQLHSPRRKRRDGFAKIRGRDHPHIRHIVPVVQHIK